MDAIIRRFLERISVSETDRADGASDFAKNHDLTSLSMNLRLRKPKFVVSLSNCEFNHRCALVRSFQNMSKRPNSRGTLIVAACAMGHIQSWGNNLIA